ncbi:MAG: DUF4097 family beta strand repeat protein [Gemmatimonadota bacterium]|nr:MAG: DUF4097 family beta strand repeat protein [Gemmatimonadota bacterium]
MLWRSMFPTAALLGCALALSVAATPVRAQQVRVVPDDAWCDDDEEDRYCEVREVTIAADRDVVRVDAAPNGGISVEAWDRNEILLRARVQAHADSESDARDLVGQVNLETGGTIGAEGPRTGHDEWWSVSYELRVPRRSSLDLKSLNGGISIDGVSGDIEFHTTNGGIKLAGLAGDISGSTRNGGLTVELSGDHWDGAGLDVQTTNGGVKLMIPEGYSARLESGTTNGSIQVDFPITLQGRIDRKITATLGDGGPTIRLFTTNGSVAIRKS